jgi:hypothetical protein
VIPYLQVSLLNSASISYYIASEGQRRSGRDIIEALPCNLPGERKKNHETSHERFPSLNSNQELLHRYRHCHMLPVTTCSLVDSYEHFGTTYSSRLLIFVLLISIFSPTQQEAGWIRNRIPVPRVRGWMDPKQKPGTRSTGLDGPQAESRYPEYGAGWTPSRSPVPRVWGWMDPKQKPGTQSTGLDGPQAETRYPEYEAGWTPSRIPVPRVQGWMDPKQKPGLHRAGD